MAVEWFEADVDVGTEARLADFDHHRFSISGRPVVLITYLTDADGDQASAPTVLAVRHDAADRHPELPTQLLDLVNQLRWREVSTPSLNDR